MLAFSSMPPCPSGLCPRGPVRGVRDVLSAPSAADTVRLPSPSQALYMFYALAIVCDDFFVPSLEKICEVGGRDWGPLVRPGRGLGVMEDMEHGSTR